ncbi:hypothetical protein ACG7TL_008225 [Trametes sanguinea]
MPLFGRTLRSSPVSIKSFLWLPGVRLARILSFLFHVRIPVVVGHKCEHALTPADQGHAPVIGSRPERSHVQHCVHPVLRVPNRHLFYCSIFTPRHLLLARTHLPVAHRALSQPSTCLVRTLSLYRLALPLTDSGGSARTVSRLQEKWAENDTWKRTLAVFTRLKEVRNGERDNAFAQTLRIGALRRAITAEVKMPEILDGRYIALQEVATMQLSLAQTR